MPTSRALVSLVLFFGLCIPSLARAQSVSVDSNQTFQSIDGFGTMGSGGATYQWWQDLYFKDLAASMVRMDITPTFTSTYSNLLYCSPWFGQPSPLELDTATSGHNGPDGTRTRPYTSAANYSASFGGCSAPIAVMGPNIDDNVKLFDFSAQKGFGLAAQLGKMKAAELGGFKLYASMWSPAPWVKVSTDVYGGSGWPFPSAGAHFPFIWAGNFAGGQLDVSGTALSQFYDGTANTSALTQWARGLAAFLRGFQNTYGVSFYAISLQNELNFEEFYNSMTYPQAPAYITALKAARAELDKYDDLKTIKIMGPEDLLGDGAYALWEYGSGSTGTHKNLQYLTAISQDSTAEAAIAGFAIHGYAQDGVNSAGASAGAWSWWANGWTTSPAAGIPANVAGFTSYDKPSWMTETSGEQAEWLASSADGGFPDSGGFSIAIKILQALTAGQESAWLYWQFSPDTPDAGATTETLTDGTQLSTAPKYVAVKHFFKFIRPGAQRIGATVSGSTNLLASAFHLASTNSTTLVLINESSSAQTATVALPAVASAIKLFDAYTSSNGSLWQSSTLTVSSNSLSVPMPAYSVATLVSVSPVSGSDGGTDGGGIVLDGGSDAGADAGSDAGTDAGLDAGSDAGTHDAGSSDAGSNTTDGGEQAATASSGCSSGPNAVDFSWLLSLGAFALLRRREERS